MYASASSTAIRSTICEPRALLFKASADSNGVRGIWRASTVIISSSVSPAVDSVDSGTTPFRFRSPRCQDNLHYVRGKGLVTRTLEAGGNLDVVVARRLRRVGSLDS